MTDQKIVLITGASSGIGECTAIEYAKLGYRVAITGRNRERLDKVHGDLISSSPLPDNKLDNFLAIQADFEDPKQVESIVEQTIAKFKRIDILINNAGYLGKSRLLQDADFYDDFQRIMQVNLFATVRICQLARPYLVESKGVIVNVSSIADTVAMPSTSYNVSKAGLSMLTKTLTIALDGTGVRVLTVAPGPVVTNIADHANIEGLSHISSLHRPGQPQEVADTIVFLTSQKASYITGCSVVIDGGACTKFGGTFVKQKFE